MAFVLTTAQAQNGLGNQAGQALLSLKRFATLTPPVTITDMRNELEAGQPVGYITNNDWDSFLTDLGNLGLDYTSLIASERAIINTIRQAINPEPQQACCGIVVPSSGDGLTAINGYYRTGTTAPYQYTIEVELDSTLTCDIKSIDCTLVGAPAVTSSNPFTLYFARCEVIGGVTKSIFSTSWVEWGLNPAGNSFDVNYDFKDANGISIAAYAATYLLNL